MKEQPTQYQSNRWIDLPLVMGLALALRLPGLAAFLTADEARSWFGRSIIFLDAVARETWANTGPGGSVPYIENVSLSPAPGVTTMWLGALGILLEYWRQGASIPITQFLVEMPFDPLDPAMLFWLRLPGVLVTVLAVGLTYLWSRALLGRWGALLTAGLIALDPFYLALSRVLGHDAPVTTFMWLSLLAFLRTMPLQKLTNDESMGLPRPALRPAAYILLSGIFGGMAFLSKYPALFIGPFIGLTMLILYIRQPVRPSAAGRHWLRDLLLWSLTAGIIFIVLWPAMWVDPEGPPATILADALRASGGAHQKGSFFLGHPVPDPGLFFYPLAALLRLSPVVLVGLILAGVQLARRKAPYPAYILLAYIILYTALITYGGKKQDRYLLPAFPALAMLAAMGYLWLREQLAARWRSLAMYGLLLLQLILIWPSYPYYFSYYSGGPGLAARLIQVGWGEGLNEAAAYLNSLPEAAESSVTAWYSTTFEPYFEGRAIYKIDEEKISRSAKPGLAADYVVFYINQVQRRLPSEGALAFFRQEPPLHTVSLNGQPYAWIYSAPALPHIIGGEARLVGQAELLGFELLDQAGERLAEIPSGSVATLRLYWEWQGKAPDDPIQLSLVDEAGHTWGWANPVDSGQAGLQSRCVTAQCEEEGLIVISEYALVIFPGTPPGLYRLAAWIDSAESGQVIGRFPLAPADSPIRISRAATPPRPEDFNIESRIDRRFGPLRLFGYSLDDDIWQPGASRTIELFWELSAAPDGDSLPDEARLTLQPQAEQLPPISWERNITPAYPPDRWQPGDRFREIWTLSLPRQAAKGRYNLTLSLAGQRRSLGRVEIGGRDRLFEPPPIAHPLEATLGDSIRLLGYELDTGCPLSLTLYWRAIATPAADYTVFVQLLDGDNRVTAQQDKPPPAPTGTWLPGEVVSDSYNLACDSAAGNRLITGMYRPDTGERLPITAGGDTMVDALLLRKIEAE